VRAGVARSPWRGKSSIAMQVWLNDVADVESGADVDIGIGRFRVMRHPFIEHRYPPNPDEAVDVAEASRTLS
jgi:hypothetical protein